MKNDVREFYDNIGWSQVGEGDARYQNARYEDLRPVAQEYIHKCHMRVNRHIAPEGRYLLDAGSGPIQYPEYLTYSEGYRYRVCADMSITALKEARERIGDHGLFVVADIAHLPFKKDAFDGIVTLHTIHHLPAEEHIVAYRDLHRVLAPDRQAVVVNGWSTSAFMDSFRTISRLRKRLWLFARRVLGRGSRDAGRKPEEGERLPDDAGPGAQGQASTSGEAGSSPPDAAPGTPKKTFVEKHDPRWFRRTVAAEMDARILVWRSASVHFTKNYIFENRGGRRILDWIFRLEERYPRFFGEKGMYPLIVIKKRSAHANPPDPSGEPETP